MSCVACCSHAVTRETLPCSQGDAGAETELGPESELPFCLCPTLDHCSFPRDCGDRMSPQKKSCKRGIIPHALRSRAAVEAPGGAGRAWCHGDGERQGLVRQGLTPVSCPVSLKPEGMPCFTNNVYPLTLLPMAKVLLTPSLLRVWTPASHGCNANPMPVGTFSLLGNFRLEAGTPQEVSQNPG